MKKPSKKQIVITGASLGILAIAYILLNPTPITSNPCLNNTNFTCVNSLVFHNGMFVFNNTSYIIPFAVINGTRFNLSQFPLKITYIPSIVNYFDHYKFGLHITNPIAVTSSINSFGFYSNGCKSDCKNSTYVSCQNFSMDFSDLVNSGFSVTATEDMVTITNTTLLSQTSIDLDPLIGPLALCCCDYCDGTYGEEQINSCNAYYCECVDPSYCEAPPPTYYYKADPAGNNCTIYYGIATPACATNTAYCGTNSYVYPASATCTLTVMSCYSGSCKICGSCNSAGSCNTMACGSYTSAGLWNNCSGTNVCNGLGTGSSNCVAKAANGGTCYCGGMCTSGYCNSSSKCTNPYYANKTNQCGFTKGADLNCGGTVTTTYCTTNNFYPTQACSASPTNTACIAESNVTSCAICGNCAGGADTCNAVACGTTNSYGCGVGKYCSSAKGTGSCNSPFSDGHACNCTLQCTSPATCVSNVCTGGVKDLNWTLTGGQSSIIYGAPPLPTSQCINATGQTATYGIINVTNNGTAGTEAIQVRLSAIHENVDIVCNSSASCIGTILTTSHQTIIASLTQGNYAYIWCWANYNTPTTVGSSPTTYLQPA